MTTQAGLDENVCWEAVVAKDANSDGRFVFAVRSTRIYCRPSCPARRPRREQVLFFDEPDAAETAGFRACRRCHPREVSVYELQQTAVENACRYIEAHLDTPVTLAALSGAVALSPYHLQKTFKKIMGITPRQYAEACRMSRLKLRLKEGDTVTGAAYESGYGSSSRLYERAGTQLGMTPATYRKGGRGMHIRYTITTSPLGRLLIGATERGICALYMGDEDMSLEAALVQEYPAAELRRADADLAAWAAAVQHHMSGAQPQLDLPLDVQATAFQWRVWQALQAIPYGSTRTYREIAQSLGKPQAARAVGRACATNPVSIVIPCHRAIREDGGLGGYRWGLDRKQTLLEREHAVAAAPEHPRRDY